MNTYNLRPLWNSILDVYSAVSSICKRERIRYFVAYGSALGAVRHNGFIPWDDDMDLVMPFEDYQRFLSIADECLPAYYALVTSKNTPGFDYNYAKISDLRRDKVLEVARASGHPLAGGINLDIFPISAVPIQKLGSRLFSYLLKMRRSYVVGNAFPTLKSKIGWTGGALMGLFLHRYSSQAAFESLCVQQQSFMGISDSVGYYDITQCRHVECVPAKCYDKVYLCRFEGIEVPIPGDYDLYLKSLYGDYLTPVKPTETSFTHGRIKPQVWRFGPINGKKL